MNTLAGGIVLALLCSQMHQAAPVTCNHESCNPAYEPFPNLHAAMVGYHIMSGNPFDQSTLYDPGFKTSFIFLPMIKNAQHKYELHSGVTATGRSSCQLSMSNDVITNVESYQTKVVERATQGVDFASNNEVEIEAGAKGVSMKGKIPPIVTAKFSASNAFGENEAFFTKDQGVVTMSDATCPAYTLHQSRFNPPPFSTQFINGVQFLEKHVNKTEPEKDTAFRYFIEEFGTHYISFAVMGARIAITSRYTSKEYQQQGQSNIEKCNSHKVGVSVGLSVSAEKSKCKTTNGANSKYLTNGMHRYYVSSYGSKPKASLIDWANQQFDEPVPIKMQLSPLTNLFQSHHMNPARMGTTVDFNAILKFFGPRYWSYCEDNKDRMGVDTCDPSQAKGCGWNDNCVRGVQSCINSPGRKDGYYCCNDPCKVQKCGNHGKCSADMKRCAYTCTCDEGWGGRNCQDRYIVAKQLKTLVKEEMRKGVDRNNEYFRGDLSNFMKREFPDYYFQIMVMDDDGAEWSIRGYESAVIWVKETYKKSVVVAWRKKGGGYAKDWSATYKQAINLVSNKGCNSKNDKERVWNYAAPKGAMMVMVARHGSGLRGSSNAWGYGGDLTNFTCGRSCNVWGSCEDHSSSLVMWF